jgi:hypothetical protein
MGEFLLELLLGFAEVFLEVLLQFAGEALLDLASRALAMVFEESEIKSPVLAAGYAILGVLAGGVSVGLFPHPLVHPSRIHGISLLVAPVTTGLMMSCIGSVLRRHDKKVVRIESFGYGFAFALGMALVRLVLVK